MMQKVVQKGARSMSTAPAPMQSVFDKLLSKSHMPCVPLNIEFPGVPALSEGASVDTEVKQTTLDNGLRVISQDSSSPISSVGAFIDAGSRYENHTNSGISHFLELIAFKSTKNQSDFKLVRDMCKIGAKVVCSTSREHTLYVADSLREYMPQTLATLSDVIQNPKFDKAELMQAREVYAASSDARAAQADVQIMEGIHAAAYFNNSLGLPVYAPKHNLPLFDEESLSKHVATFFTPSRTVVSGVGVDHSEFVKQVASTFNSMPKGDSGLETAKASYTGGEVRMHNPGSNDPFAHVALAFETASWHDKDLVPMCVLQMMMGGGGSFSAGGPGKGMYSRLYETVLNRYNWVESATSFNAIFNDSSLFGIYGTAEAQNAGQLTEVLVDQLIKMAGKVEDQDLSRAKAQLKSAVHMQLESQGLQLEDLGRQILTYGHVKSPADICASIDTVTGADIQRVASDMLKTPVSVAAYGDLSYLPRYDTISRAFSA